MLTPCRGDSELLQVLSLVYPWGQSNAGPQDALVKALLPLPAYHVSAAS